MNNYIFNQSKIECIKSLVRVYLYPILFYFQNILTYHKWKKRYLNRFNRITIGQKGNDYASLRYRVNKYRKIKGSKVLIIGCGEGQDIESWLRYKPTELYAIDYMDYSKIWASRNEYFLKKYNLKVNFIQANVEDLSFLENNYFDMICSDAVFEHLKNYKLVISRLYSLLKVSGILYATFGPLWTTFGGDIISGTDHCSNGFNHLLLNKYQYNTYVNKSITADDYRYFYFENDFFSRLKIDDYINFLLENNYTCLYQSVVISKKALMFKKFQLEKFNLLLKSYSETDLISESITIIYAK